MRNPKDKDEVLNSCDYYYEGSFDNDNPICLEIGMGKGQFILNMAINNPNINFIGVEKYSSVASVAIKKINEYKPSNLKILIGDIANIENLLDKKIDTIYLNFSDFSPPSNIGGKNFNICLSSMINNLPLHYKANQQYCHKLEALFSFCITLL